MDSFDDLFQRYSKDVFRFLFKLCGYNQTLAEDLMQDTFLYVYLGLSDFRSECPIKTWILQIAKNRYFLYLRNKKHMQTISLDDLLSGVIDDTAIITIDKIYQKQLISDSLDIVFSFPPKMSAVFIQRIYYDMPYKEIAQQLCISEGSAKMLFHRTKLQLQMRLREDYGYEI